MSKEHENWCLWNCLAVILFSEVIVYCIKMFSIAKIVNAYLSIHKTQRKSMNPADSEMV